MVPVTIYKIIISVLIRPISEIVLNRKDGKDKITINKSQMITPTGGFACRRTNKFQFLITKMILNNQFTIWSLIFFNYLRFEICDLLFRAEASLREINHKIFTSLLPVSSTARLNASSASFSMPCIA